MSRYEFLDIITMEYSFHLLKLIKRQTVSVNYLLTTVEMVTMENSFQLLGLIKAQIGMA